MPARTTARGTRAYKDVTFQQLRSFGETARKGSLAAAAAALGLAHPTVWIQVHALEREYGVKLVEPGVRGCRLTEAGRLLAALSAPLIEGVGSLKQEFLAAHAGREIRLSLVTTPRVLVEDIPECLDAFQRRWPRVRLVLLEKTHGDMAAMVESGDADLALTGEPIPQDPSPRLGFEPAYPLERILVTPRDHPLARRRGVRPEDLRKYPFVNARESTQDPRLRAMLEQLGVFQTQPRRVEAFTSAVVRRYVKAGFGIGLTSRLASAKPDPGLHERSMSRYFGRLDVNLVWRRNALRGELVRSLLAAIREHITRTP